MSSQGSFNSVGNEMDEPNNYQQQQEIEIEHSPYEFNHFSKKNIESLRSPAEFFKKLDCFITLEPLDINQGWGGEDNLKIQVDQNEMKDLHLYKMFDEKSENQQKMNYNSVIQQNDLEEQIYPSQVEHQEVKSIFPPSGEKRARKSSAQLPSFQDLLDRMIENFLENFTPYKFQEYNRYQILKEAFNNIGNFICLEKKLSFPYALTRMLPHYNRFIQKMDNYYQQKRLDIKQMISFVCSMGLEFIEDVLNIIKKADEQSCFQILKQEGNNQQQNQLNGNLKFYENQFRTNNLPNQPPFQRQETNFNYLIPQQHEKVNPQPMFTQDQPPLMQINQDTVAEIELDVEKGQRKAWTQEENQELQRIISIHPNSIPSQVLQNLSKIMNRTVSSIQSKIHKMKKKPIQESESFNQQFRCQQNQKVVPSYENLSSASQSKPKQGQKYEYTVEDMIKISLEQMPDMRGSKSEIQKKIQEIFFPHQVFDSQHQWSKSVAIVLSSNQKSFLKKIKGTFALFPVPEDQLRVEGNSLKVKIYSIIKQGSGRMEFKAILDKLIKMENINVFDEIILKNFKKKANQTLIQCSWFDKRNSKTLYSLLQSNFD